MSIPYQTSNKEVTSRPMTVKVINQCTAHPPVKQKGIPI
ncbi:hypothetical protein J921_0395 [Acinetobacter baumannii 25493_8]|uniref:Uncharacterized protein n=7 Tax=Acinetobacter baumannii TaxID=470 RepID=D0CAR0_ACIB2|nr:Hypothetical protein ABK1_0440 [Acinetobacter baumannii 1656-2]AGH34263.1 hypothetical protein ABD1_03720 [Acinetobacter baumannii D1279779]AGQ12825.1 hypothetical protein BJAB07104_00455 [Acinetobacter baumannii BJAB07104]AIY38745.1 hypothetical protein ABLAC_33900 [Acinetobacter baumannii LAC-4]ALJ89424.1 hypothetical protein AN415_03539 [Acinetobacter baumannii]EEX03592.1 hypothetical protein HMPREF0010_01840 [Acinetobacter baumannii ATCC 19606 = CIP 70.34 = JCM 6841]EGK47714.1 hypothet